MGFTLTALGVEAYLGHGALRQKQLGRPSLSCVHWQEGGLPPSRLAAVPAKAERGEPGGFWSAGGDQLEGEMSGRPGFVSGQGATRSGGDPSPQSGSGRDKAVGEPHVVPLTVAGGTVESPRLLVPSSMFNSLAA